MKNFLKIATKIFTFALFVLFFTVEPTRALQIVYPKSPNTESSASSTFFVGNTKPGSKLMINDKEVKVYENGSFVEVVPLKDGFNRIIIDSQNDTEHEVFTYIIKKVPKANLMVKEPETENFVPNQYIYAGVVKENTPLRAQPDEFAQRITHLDKNTMLMLNGKKGDYYRVYLSPSKTAWVKAENIVNYSTITGKMLASATNVSLTEDKLYSYIRTDLSFPVPFRITETEKGLNVEVYNLKENAADTTVFKPCGIISSFAINSVAQDMTSTYYIELNSKLWGYTAYYEGNTLVIKIRKEPQIEANNPLNGIKIAVDAGHGGEDYGAIGPTGVKEKDINLSIAKKLQAELETLGAEVVMTRTDDTDIALKARPYIAQKEDALILLSIHANALSDGANPYEKHGTSTYYYNAQAVNLAKTLRDTLTKNLGTRDDGVCRYSLVLTRPTMPLSVLIEVAYMINPQEYAMLIDENFQQKAANAIAKALETYLLNSVNPA